MKLSCSFGIRHIYIILNVSTSDCSSIGHKCAAQKVHATQVENILGLPTIHDSYILEM